MKPGARVAAAIEILTEIENHHQPAGRALAEWGRTHRFAGSSDRAVIGNLVFDTLRNRASAGWKMSDDSPRSLVLATLNHAWNKSVDEIAKLCDGSRFAPEKLSDDEREGISYQLSDADPLWVRANIPEWLIPSFERVCGENVLREGQALAKRAPIDLRVNTLKSYPEKILNTFASSYAAPTPYSSIGVRVPLPGVEQKMPLLEATPEHAKGYFEIQDEGSQIAAMMADARADIQVMDYCAGGGGKTLALAAGMENQGQLYAYDTDPHRLRRIFERLKRAGVRNTQVLRPGDDIALNSLAGRMDVVLVDAPCSGTGTWRRRPDIKWRLSSNNLQSRITEQAAILDAASKQVRQGGRLVYVTCSLLPEENEDQINAFVERNPDFKLVPYERYWWAAFRKDPIASAVDSNSLLQLTPAQHNTDGFFIAILTHSKAPVKPQAPSDFSWDGLE